MEENKKVNSEKSQEEIVKEAVEEAKKAAEAEAEAQEASEEADAETTAEAAEDKEPSDEEDKEEGAEKKGIFGKKNKKDKKDEKIEELTDKLVRQMAEFDNYRKRTDKEKSQMYEVGARDIIEKILPVVDNFERGLAAVTEEEKDSPFVQGMDKIYKQMMSTLDEMGVKPIEAVGKEFDLNLHNAVMHIEDENYGENIVVDEFQKGYTYRDSVLRHSMVRVAN